MLEECQKATGQKLTEKEFEDALEQARDAGKSKSLAHCTLGNRPQVNVEAQATTAAEPEEPKKPSHAVHRGRVEQDDNDVNYKKRREEA